MVVLLCCTGSRVRRPTCKKGDHFATQAKHKATRRARRPFCMGWADLFRFVRRVCGQLGQLGLQMGRLTRLPSTGSIFSFSCRPCFSLAKVAKVVCGGVLTASHSTCHNMSAPRRTRNTVFFALCVTNKKRSRVATFMSAGTPKELTSAESD